MIQTVKRQRVCYRLDIHYPDPAILFLFDNEEPA